MNQKYKRLFNDTILFTLSNFGSKILIFLLVPLYTSVLSTDDYGIADLITTTVNLLHPILTLSICEATLRFALDKKVNSKSVLANSLLLTILSIVVLLICTPFVKNLTGSFKEYWWLMIGSFISTSLQICFSNYVKGCGKSLVFAIQGIIYTLVLIICNIVFLLYFKIGLRGYIFSIIISGLTSSVYMAFSAKFWKDIFTARIDVKLLKEMLIYCLPMIPTSIAWWINASADKYMVVGLVGASANGLYAAAHKIPTIMSTITNLFSQAWRISAISSYDEDENSCEFYSKIYNLFYLFCIYICMGITILSQLIAKILYKSDYFSAWILIPPLLIATIFEAYSGFLSSLYAAAKKTSLLFVSTCIGAIFNIILNYILIKKLGTIGAPIATFISFIIVWIIRTILLGKIIVIKVNYVKMTISLILIIFAGMYFSYDFLYKYVVYSIIACTVVLINFKESKHFVMHLIELFYTKVSNQRRGSKNG